MPSYQAPTRDMQFVLNELLDISNLTHLAGFENVSPDLAETMIVEAGKFTSEVIAPLNQSGDRQGVTRHPDGRVTLPDGFKEAYDALCEAGWSTIVQPQRYGGQGLPHALGMAVDEFLSGANQAFAMLPGLTVGAAAAIKATGSDELKDLFLPRLVSGQWSGTMNLTEPQCGTDLGLIRTKAEPIADGSYSITGTKIFISGGEHDATENIVHLVLAKTPDAPAGTKGISLFVVPKIKVDQDGNLGEPNAVSCGSVEEKMGIHASPTCVMNYDGATGWMVGEENKGLAAMFIMMNSARLHVGVQGLGQAEAAFQNAVAYARERRQGRALTGPAEPDQPADLIIVHPDVRRMLMDAKCYTEGMRALAVWTALQIDITERAPDEKDREAAQDLIELLTPVIKGYGTDRGYEVATDMQQVLGGHGYIVEWGMEQFVRDARITMIYEGANGVQAMDLCGRKLGQHGGRAIRSFFALVDAECDGTDDEAAVGAIAAALKRANGDLKTATMWFMRNAMTNPNNLGAGAYHYMTMMGLVSLGLMWLRIAKVATAKIASGEGDRAFYEAKLTTARYFAQRSLLDAGALRRKIEAGSEAMMAIPEDRFTYS